MISIIIDDHFMPLYIDDAQWIIDQNIKKKKILLRIHGRQCVICVCGLFVSFFHYIPSVKKKKFKLIVALCNIIQSHFNNKKKQ